MCIISIILIITLFYNGYIIIKYNKIPQSLSETSYLLGGNKRYWFTVYCACIGILLLPLLFEITKDSLLILPFIYCGGLIFSGCSPLFREGLDKLVHYSSAYIAFAAYVLYMIFCMNWIWLVIYFSILGLLCLLKHTSYIYWAEMAALFEISIFVLCCYI